jgi:predicted secreted protein with PEFG-CTERM motif
MDIWQEIKLTSRYLQSLLFGFLLVFPISNFVYAQTPTQSISVTDTSGNAVSDIKYGIINGTVERAVVSSSDDAIDIYVTTSGDGTLAITLPRTLIDATINDQDDQFFVLVDGQDVDFQESKTTTDRTLTISFPDGTSDISIVGTSVTPEFGPIVSVVLVVAIVSIIAVSTKTALRVIPRH